MGLAINLIGPGLPLSLCEWCTHISGWAIRDLERTQKDKMAELDLIAQPLSVAVRQPGP